MFTVQRKPIAFDPSKGLRKIYQWLVLDSPIPPNSLAKRELLAKKRRSGRALDRRGLFA